MFFRKLYVRVAAIKIFQKKNLSLWYTILGRDSDDSWELITLIPQINVIFHDDVFFNVTYQVLAKQRYQNKPSLTLYFYSMLCKLTDDCSHNMFLSQQFIFLFLSITYNKINGMLHHLFLMELTSTTSHSQSHLLLCLKKNPTCQKFSDLGY